MTEKEGLKETSMAFLLPLLPCTGRGEATGASIPFCSPTWYLEMNTGAQGVQSARRHS